MHIYSHTVIIGNFNTLLSPIDRTGIQKLNIETLNLNLINVLNINNNILF